MSAEEVSVIMWQLLQALKFLHANNVWHRCVSLQGALHICIVAASTFACLGVILLESLQGYKVL